MPGTTKSEGALLSALSTHARRFCNATQGCRMRIILFKTFPNGEGAALRMTWVDMTLQSVKDLRPCSQFDCCGDRMPRKQRPAQSTGSRHEVSGYQRSHSALHTLLKSLEVVMVSQAQPAACSGRMQQGCGQQNRQEAVENNRVNIAIGRLRVFCHVRFRKHARSPEFLHPLTTLLGPSPSQPPSWKDTATEKARTAADIIL